MQALRSAALFRVETGVYMRMLLYCCGLAAAGLVGAGIMATVRPPVRVVVVAPTVHAIAPSHGRRAKPAANVARAVVKPKPRPPARLAVRRLPHPRATPSLYERTTAPAVLRRQGCRAGR